MEGHYVVRGPVNKVVEGELYWMEKQQSSQNFPNKECIDNFWASEEYQSIKHKREGTGIYDIGIFEGSRLAECLMTDENIFAKILRGEMPCHKVYENESTLFLWILCPCRMAMF
jgi:hypothetical protein